MLGAVTRPGAAAPGPYTELDPFHDPLVMFAYLAGTERIEFATGVMVLPQRQTALVLGRQPTSTYCRAVGYGSVWASAGTTSNTRHLGQEFKGRGARQEEQIELLRRLFTEPVVDFAGRFHRVDRASLLPKPTRRIPIWLGGLGSGVRPGRPCCRRVHLLRWQASPRRSTPGTGCGNACAASAGLWMTSGADWIALPRGGVDTVRADVDAWREADGTLISVLTMGLGFESAEAHIEYLTSVADALSLS